MDRASHRAPRPSRRRSRLVFGLAVGVCLAVGAGATVLAGSMSRRAEVHESTAPATTDRGVTPAEDRRTGRLLAVIALICVVGVTSGIIRAILAQRANAADQRLT